ncbi:hypothetical protein [Paenibacillus hamazuiensis]|uniref:hypothetical protein n=1 Tax=Paenibacillus hamazuiensis TaxID=2936508 RepID=UPI00200C8377|nr:hypothetical protein [Paenibacillus hamazuiensis]
MELWIGIMMSGAAAALLLGIWAVSRKSRNSGNVTRLKDFKKKKRNGQPCSFCRKKSEDLAFYADENGQIVGVCKSCRPMAERRELGRL